MLHRSVPLAAALACACVPPSEPEWRVFGGTPDDTRAVVALVGDHGTCTGTFVARDDHEGVVLTAAHCLASPPTEVWFGDDLHAPESVHEAVDVQSHPAFVGGLYDAAIVRFSRPPADVDPIPILSPREDELVAGTDVVFAGYGRTDDGSVGERRSVGGALTGVDAHSLSYEQEHGGPCQGDSGGPALVDIDGQWRVAGVTSHGDPGCTIWGASVRASALARWLRACVADGECPTTCDGEASCAATECGFTPEPMLSCQACMETLCCGDGSCRASSCAQACTRPQPPDPPPPMQAEAGCAVGGRSPLLLLVLLWRRRAQRLKRSSATLSSPASLARSRLADAV